jgi:hypothetical protein
MYGASEGSECEGLERYASGSSATYRVSGKRNSRLRLDVLRPLQSQPEPRWTFSSGKVANRNRREIFERKGRGAFSFRLLEKGRRRARRPSAAVEPTSSLGRGALGSGRKVQ